MVEMIKPGDVVGAGYTVVAVHVQQDGRGAALAYRIMLDHPAGGEYAVWTLCPDGDRIHGGYTANPRLARDLFVKRVGDVLAGLWEPAPTIGGVL